MVGPEDVERLPDTYVRSIFWDGMGLVRLNCIVRAGNEFSIGRLAGRWVEPIPESALSAEWLKFEPVDNAPLTTGAAVTEMLHQWECPVIRALDNERGYEMRCGSHEVKEYPISLDLRAPVEAIYVKRGHHFTKDPEIFIFQAC